VILKTTFSFPPTLIAVSRMYEKGGVR